MIHEGDVHGPAWFVTLTYKDGEVPANGSLSPEDPTRFFKRLRKREAGQLSYFYCGEYGETTSRPHYHAVLFGAPLLDRSLHNVRHGAHVYVSETLESAWTHGLTEFTGLTYPGALYTARYVRKKVREQEGPEHYDRVDPDTGEVVRVAREYAQMSRRPAIGRRWIEKYWEDVYPRDMVVMDGHEMKPPRYYDKWMDKHHPEAMLEVRERRYAEAKELSGRELEAKQKVHQARVGLFEGRNQV